MSLPGGREKLGQQRAFLVALQDKKGTWRASLAELQQLVFNAGAGVVGTLTQRRDKPHVSTYIGSGKLEQLHAACLSAGADLAVFDDELTAAQARDIEQAIGVPVLDRTEVILDIFARRARSAEGKIQVELAQLRYRLPRLVGRGEMLSRLGGGRVRGLGMGARGPGEQKLEIDRRRLRHRIGKLEGMLKDLRRRRQVERGRRLRMNLPLVALVGYTNGGKSTLLNTLTGSDVSVRDRLFETLDTTVRRADLGDGVRCLVSDTVGFIRRLPQHLIAAFRATLEEVLLADVLVQVADANSPEVYEQMAASSDVLRELEADDKPMIIALNKIDMIQDASRLDSLLSQVPGSVPISATLGDGVTSLKQRIAEALGARLIPLTLHIPYDKVRLLSVFRKRGCVVSEDYQETKVVAQVEVREGLARQLKDYVVAER